ncbi:metallophosphoesterase [Pseudomonas luteola]
MSKIIEIRKNTKGVDLFGGDIHGSYTEFVEELERRNFDTRKDRAIILGDLTDRGSTSHRAPEFLDEPWFISVQGNHDAFAYYTARELLSMQDKGIPYGSISRDCPNFHDIMTCIQNGGTWLLGQPRHVLEDIVRTFKELPLAIEYQDTDGTPIAGLLHAELAKGTSWQQLKTILQDLPSDFVFSLEGDYPKALVSCVWGRSKATASRTTPVEALTSDGIPYVFCGHNIVSPSPTGPVRIANNRLIDHGLYKTGTVRLYTLDEMTQ